MNAKIALTKATTLNGPRINKDKNLAGFTAAKTAPIATDAKKINNHQPAIPALPGDTRFLTKLW